MGKRKVATVNTRSEGGKVEPHGGRSPKDLGPQKGNDKGPKRTQVNLRPENAAADFDAGQHGGSKEK